MSVELLPLHQYRLTVLPSWTYRLVAAVCTRCAADRMKIRNTDEHNSVRRKGIMRRAMNAKEDPAKEEDERDDAGDRDRSEIATDSESTRKISDWVNCIN